MMRRMNEQTGTIDPNLGTAKRAMKDAAEALRGDRPGAATGPQGDALRGLQETGRQLLDEIGEGNGQANREGQDAAAKTGARTPLAAAPAAAAARATRPCRRRANAKKSAIFSTSYAGARPKAIDRSWNANIWIA